jgi:ubiquinone/menaquinone biosynthesis C-methylase UbiE
MDPAEIGRIFDARAPRYVRDDWHRRYAEQFVAAVPVRSGDLVLDAGTGTGFAACAIARRVGPTGRVLAVDLSEGMLAHAREFLAHQRIENVELRRGE